MGVTIREVAARAGVSVATVSRVLNNSGPVRSATRLRVEQAAQDLRYSPNNAARSLITNQTLTVGVLLPDLYGEFFSEVIRGMDTVARDQGYHLLVSSFRTAPEDLLQVTRTMQGRVDGLIVLSANRGVAAALLPVSEALPLLLLNGDAHGHALDAINIDNELGARRMVDHLIRLGHHRIAVIRGPDQNLDATERLRGYRAALQAHGLAPDPALHLQGDFTEASGRAAAAHLLGLSERPTALFASNDSMALGALLSLREAGLSIPGDMAVAGFDDLPLARYVTPALSSVHVPVQEMGTLAMDRLLDVLAGRTDPSPWQYQLEPTLIPRRSCGHTGPLRRSMRAATMHPPNQSTPLS